MVTVKEVFDFAVETDMVLLAHKVYWAISKQLVSLEDDTDKLKLIDYDEQEIDGLIKRNMLDIGRIKLFVIQTNQEGWFSFYFAENSLDAYRLHSELFRERGGKITQADRLMIPVMAFADSGKEERLLDYKKNVVEYPAYVGHARAGEHVLYRLGV